MSDTKNIEDKILVEISKTKSLKELQEIKVRELGKKGRISSLMRTLSELSSDEKKILGKSYNELRVNILEAFEAKELWKKLSFSLISCRYVLFNCSIV